MSVVFSSPAVEAYRVEPMSVSEVDAHPDAARIWATIMEVRASYDGASAEEVEALEKEVSDLEDRVGDLEDEVQDTEKQRDEAYDALNDTLVVINGGGECADIVARVKDAVEGFLNAL